LVEGKRPNHAAKTGAIAMLNEIEDSLGSRGQRQGESHSEAERGDESIRGAFREGGRKVFIRIKEARCVLGKKMDRKQKQLASIVIPVPLGGLSAEEKRRQAKRTLSAPTPRFPSLAEDFRGRQPE